MWGCNYVKLINKVICWQSWYSQCDTPRLLTWRKAPSEPNRLFPSDLAAPGRPLNSECVEPVENGEDWRSEHPWQWESPWWGGGQTQPAREQRKVQVSAGSWPGLPLQFPLHDMRADTETNHHQRLWYLRKLSQLSNSVVSRGFVITDLVRVRLTDSFEVKKYCGSDEIFPANTHRVLDTTDPPEIFPRQRRLHHPGGLEPLLPPPGHQADGAPGNPKWSVCPLGVHVCLQHATR